MKEIWKVMKEHNGYEVSNYGKIKNIKTGRILKTTINYKGYERFIIYIDKKPKCFYIHRVVANNFLDNPNNYKEINHINENKLDNRVCNLEYCTSKYNANYGKRNENVSQNQIKYNIIQKDRESNVIKIWNSMWEIIHNTDFKKSNIQKCCQGKQCNAYGFKWEYKPVLK